MVDGVWSRGVSLHGVGIVSSVCGRDISLHGPCNATIYVANKQVGTRQRRA